MKTFVNKELIIFGETIWDLFEDGSKHLGGSGLNVAWHLKGLGQDCHFLSRVGQDALGDELLENMKNWNLSIEHVQLDATYPTGHLTVILDEINGHRYPSPPELAFDFIQWHDAWAAWPKDAFVYHGTYILRNPQTRGTIAKMKKEGFSMFMDLNLRENYWSIPLLDEWVRDVAYVKVSDQEFPLWMQQPCGPMDQDIALLQRVMKKQNIANVLYTLGPEGSIWIEADTHHVQKPIKPLTGAANTVGAGDAYCAGVLAGLMQGWPLKDCLTMGTQIAEAICHVPGATSHQKDFYLSIK